MTRSAFTTSAGQFARAPSGKQHDTHSILVPLRSKKWDEWLSLVNDRDRISPRFTKVEEWSSFRRDQVLHVKRPCMDSFEATVQAVHPDHNAITGISAPPYVWSKQTLIHVCLAAHVGVALDVRYCHQSNKVKKLRYHDREVGLWSGNFRSARHYSECGTTVKCFTCAFLGANT